MTVPWGPRRKAAIDALTPALRFELELDACCVLCNPVAVADYETPCVRVVSEPLIDAPTFCADCVRYMAAVLQVRPKKPARKKAAR